MLICNSDVFFCTLRAPRHSGCCNPLKSTEKVEWSDISGSMVCREHIVVSVLQATTCFARLSDRHHTHWPMNIATHTRLYCSACGDRVQYDLNYYPTYHDFYPQNTSVAIKQTLEMARTVQMSSFSLAKTLQPGYTYTSRQNIWNALLYCKDLHYQCLLKSLYLVFNPIHSMSDLNCHPNINLVFNLIS